MRGDVSFSHSFNCLFNQINPIIIHFWGMILFFMIDFFASFGSCKTDMSSSDIYGQMHILIIVDRG